MIMFWNQKEVYVGYSLQKLGEIKDMLAANNIKYKSKLANHHYSSSRRSQIGTIGENMEYANIYYVYVHKKDYDKACAVLHYAG